MGKGRLIVPEISKYKTASLVCAGLSMAIAVFAVLSAVVAVFFALTTDSVGTATRVALVIVAVVSVVAAAQAFYEFYGVLRSHVTLAHFGYALIAYPVLDVLVSKSTEYAEYAQIMERSATVTVMRHIDYLNLVVNIIDILLWLALGAVFLLYASGKLRDRRSAVIISGGAFLLNLVTSIISYISYFAQTGISIGALLAILMSVGFAAGSAVLAYGVPFFLALSMENAKEDIND